MHVLAYDCLGMCHSRLRVKGKNENSNRRMKIHVNRVRGLAQRITGRNDIWGEMNGKYHLFLKNPLEGKLEPGWA